MSDIDPPVSWEEQQYLDMKHERDTLRDERDRLITEYARLFRLCEPIAKMLSELSILPIGCSREQELAWKMAVKNVRHYQRDYAADVLLQAALTPAVDAGGGKHDSGTGNCQVKG